MYVLSGFPENLNIMNCVNLVGNCVHYMYGMSGFAENWNSVYTLINCMILTRIYVY